MTTGRGDMREHCGIKPWCEEHERDGGSDFCRAWVEIPGVGWVQLTHVTGEGTVAYVTDPKRGLHENDTRGLYEIDDLEAVGNAYLEAARIARSDVMSASGTRCGGVRAD